jgi:hypothetical protein
MNNITINKLVSILKDWSNSNPLINEFTYGIDYDFATSKSFSYPLMYVDLDMNQSINILNNTNDNQIMFNISFLDLLNDQHNLANKNGYESNNTADILSDSYQLIEDLLTFLRSYQAQKLGIFLNDQSAVITKVFDEWTDKVVGMTVNLLIRFDYNVCMNFYNPNILYSYSFQDEYGNNLKIKSINNKNIILKNE